MSEELIKRAVGREVWMVPKDQVKDFDRLNSALLDYDRQPCWPLLIEFSARFDKFQVCGEDL